MPVTDPTTKWESTPLKYHQENINTAIMRPAKQNFYPTQASTFSTSCHRGNQGLVFERFFINLSVFLKNTNKNQIFLLKYFFSMKEMASGSSSNR